MVKPVYEAGLRVAMRNIFSRLIIAPAALGIGHILREPEGTHAAFPNFKNGLGDRMIPAIEYFAYSSAATTQTMIVIDF